jgi:hypothetical protein
MKRPGFHHFNSFTIKTGLISIITLAFSTFTVKSQVTFEITIPSLNKQTGEDIIQTHDGSYAVIGLQGGAFHQWPMDHFLFYKLDQTGSVVKMTLFADGFDASWGSEIIQTEDNGFIACGSGNGLLNEPYLVKYNPVGDTNWTKVINQESGYNVSLSICQTYDHGFALCGTLSLAAMIVIRTDASGEKIWQKVFDDPDCYDESAECIIETNDSSLVICGYRNDSLALIKLNPEGDSIWMKCFTEQPLRGYSLKQTDDQGFIITGSTKIEAGNSDVLLLKTNENGETIWEKHIGGIVNDFAVDLDITSDKGFIICGTTRGNNDLNSDVYLIKTDQNGDTIWTKKFGGNLYEEGRGIDCTLDGGYIISGYKYLNDTLYNIYLIKTDAQGMVGIVTEESKDMLKMLSVFPNPCSEMLNVECSMLDAGSYYELIVYDTFGLQVLSGGKAAGDRNWTSSRIEVSSLPSGVYFISVLEDGKRIAGGKFILER